MSETGGKRLVFGEDGEVAKSVPMAKKRKLIHSQREGRPWTLSVAIPGSIMKNAQTLELRTNLAGQIARCLTIFKVDEVIVFDEPYGGGTDKAIQQDKDAFNACHFLCRLLQYQECPQYLRKSFFPVHRDLKLAGLLNPLDAPHHMRIDEWHEFREGVVVPKHQRKSGPGSLVDAGLYQQVHISKKLQAGSRVTVRFESNKRPGKFFEGAVVSPDTPREEKGYYWGYTTRLANDLTSVFSECPHEGGYDVKIGTSQYGEEMEKSDTIPTFKHAVIVFGGIRGLEETVKNDDTLECDDPAILFDHFINPCPEQGSRSIRTEENMLITLSLLRPLLNTNTE